MELPFTIEQICWSWLFFTLITNTWLVFWAYSNWKMHRVKEYSTSVHLVPKESYDDLDQDEKDFYGIKS